MKKISAFIALYIAFLTPGLNALDLEKGTNQNVGMGFTDEQREALPIITQAVRRISSSEETGPSLAFLQFGETTTWYRLYSSFKVYGVNVLNGNLIGRSTLSPFEDPDLEPEITNLYQEFDITPQARTFDNLVPSLGCFPRYPLRYGDVTGDGNMELVIFAQDEFYALNLTLFSTVLNKTIFSIRLSTYDAVLNTRKELPEGEEESASYPLADDPKDGQYLSRIVEQRTRMVSGIRPAIINFSKLYIDSFSAEDAHDLLVWRKLYRSRLNEDPIEGFELERDTFHHYQLVEGDYIQQDTDEATIKGWLAENELTWQKGYPNKSECEGEEGELIPEMHDPLLNDPDVLQ